MQPVAKLSVPDGAFHWNWEVKISEFPDEKLNGNAPWSRISDLESQINLTNSNIKI